MLPTADTRGVFTREEALEAGWTARSIRTQLANDRWSELARGVYVESLRLNAAKRVERHRLEALAQGLRRDVVLTGGSAACVHGFSVLYSSITDVTTRRRSRFGDDDVVIVEGVAITAPALTVIECARRFGPEPGLVIADTALRVGAVRRVQLDEQLDRFAGQPGALDAAIVVAEADARAATPLESISRWRFLCAKLPRPDLQMEIDTGVLPLYYTDFGWKEERTVGEADGIIKYDEEGNVIRAEKIRESRIEDAGYEIARWIWDEMWNTPDLVVTRVLRTFATARNRFGLSR